MEGANMDTAVEKTQGKTGMGSPKVFSLKEVDAMRFAQRITKVKIPVKVLVGLAAGAMLITGTAFVYQGLTQDKLGNHPAGSEITQGFQAPTYPGSQDYEAGEKLFDEVREAFVGIASSSSETTQAFEVEEPEAPVIGVPAFSSSETEEASQASAYWLQKTGAEEMLLDELSKSFIGVPASWINETTEAFQDPVYLGSQDPDIAEQSYDDNRASFTGVLSSGS
jgi:hypothetical protein